MSKEFLRFSNNLYCAGAEEQRCPNGLPAGTCYWFRPNALVGMSPLVAADANRSWEENSKRYPTDRWDPPRAGATGFRYFNREAAAACVDGKRLHFAGDSTTRDTFYEFAAVVGHPIFAGGAGAWPDGAYEPRSPFSSAGRDRNGECLGNYDRRKFCLRDEKFPSTAGARSSSASAASSSAASSSAASAAAAASETRLSFQFLMRSNSTWEVEQATKMLADRRLDAAFVQCPIYEWFKPDAYNYSKSKEERARVVDVEDDLAVGPRHWAGMGVSCADYVDNVLRPAISAAGGYVQSRAQPHASVGDGGRGGGGGGGGGGGADANGKGSGESNAAGGTSSLPPPSRVFVLGPTPLPMWTRLHGTDAVEPRVFDSIHRGLGLRCHKHTADGTWAVHSKSGVTPIDRYAVVGGRRRDAIHPFFNAQFAIVQLMLNHLCPAGP